MFHDYFFRTVRWRCFYACEDQWEPSHVDAFGYSCQTITKYDETTSGLYLLQGFSQWKCRRGSLHIFPISCKQNWSKLYEKTQSHQEGGWRGNARKKGQCNGICGKARQENHGQSGESRKKLNTVYKVNLMIPYDTQKREKGTLLSKVRNSFCMFLRLLIYAYFLHVASPPAHTYTHTQNPIVCSSEFHNVVAIVM